jgi:hypothetical protein
MKKLFGLLLIAIIALSSCADSKTFERADGTKFVAEPYGWANYQSNKIDGVVYKVCIDNIVWDVIAAESIVIPIWLTGWELYEPVSYIEPNSTR